MALMFAFLEFGDANGREGHVSYMAKQLNRYLHDGFYWPEYDRVLKRCFKYSWWSAQHGTMLNIGLDLNPEALGAELSRLRELFPSASRAQIFEPEYGIPEGAEIIRNKPPAKVIQIVDYLRVA